MGGKLRTRSRLWLLHTGGMLQFLEKHLYPYIAIKSGGSIYKMKALNWNDKTRYMEIERGRSATNKGDNEYKGRPVLPEPITVAT
jgi:hypothetical protein